MKIPYSHNRDSCPRRHRSPVFISLWFKGGWQSILQQSAPLSPMKTIASRLLRLSTFDCKFETHTRQKACWDIPAGLSPSSYLDFYCLLFELTKQSPVPPIIFQCPTAWSKLIPTIYDKNQKEFGPKQQNPCEYLRFAGCPYYINIE